MKKLFDWTDENFIETFVRNPEQVKQIILSQKCISIFQKVHSANQILFYAYSAIKNIKKIIDKINQNPNMDNFDLLQEFQTNANYHMFTFVQCVLPYRDAITSSCLFDKEKLNLIFKENEQFDFFRSLRNLQTHVSVPVFQWEFHKDFLRKTSYIDIRINNLILNSIKDFKDGDENKGHNFKKGGYEFIIKNKQIPIYILSNDFLKYLYNIHSEVYSQMLKKYGEELDCCEYYLAKMADYTERTILQIIQRNSTKKLLPEKVKPQPKRFEHILRNLGGLPYLPQGEQV